MAARDGAGQYEDAFRPHRLQNWGVPLPRRQRPPLRGGPTQIIADDRGHLLPDVPRCQASPWGSFLGTWDLPRRLPPARLDLTARSAAAAALLLQRSRQPCALSRARNGLRTQLTGKPQQPGLDTPTSKKPSQRSSQAPREDSGVPTSIPASIPPHSKGGHSSGSHRAAGFRSQPGGLRRGEQNSPAPGIARSNAGSSPCGALRAAQPPLPGSRLLPSAPLPSRLLSSDPFPSRLLPSAPFPSRLLPSAPLPSRLLPSAPFPSPAAPLCSLPLSAAPLCSLPLPSCSPLLPSPPQLLGSFMKSIRPEAERAARTRQEELCGNSPGWSKGSWNTELELLPCCQAAPSTAPRAERVPLEAGRG
ncbi:protein Flattop [Pogoniulus pusillus]|uniref:protein Flattop n=1 Tax=Pogoniulus pusillus TaxID=488313 RepID=UPI0030B92E82